MSISWIISNGLSYYYALKNWCTDTGYLEGWEFGVRLNFELRKPSGECTDQAII